MIHESVQSLIYIENEVQEEIVNETVQQEVNIEDNLTSNEVLNENNSEDISTHSIVDDQAETNEETKVLKQ